MLLSISRRWSLPRTAFCLTAVIASTGLTACSDDGNGVQLDETRNERSTAEFEQTGTGEVSEVSDVPSTGVIVPVVALDNSFRPELIEVSVGDQVQWENRGGNEHNVLSIEGPDDWGIEVDQFQPGDVYVHTFTEPGEYHYFCSIHGIETVGMIGTVVVTA